MEYIYAAMLVHKAGGKVDEATVTKVLQAANVKVDAARVKALVAALEGVNIDEAVKKAAVVAAPAASAPAAATQQAGGKKEEKKSAAEEKKTEEAAAAGLGALFG
ncbi:50S ribosomal protein P1 [Candidatus Woesearchaeota archaeon]|nr:50S ribosomal protein P1 [Candidatus Woesearchaeota archaeon]